MRRLAIVTGGTRGIGRAIAQSLREDGHVVVATYHGNERAADAFRRETGIVTYRWDVADFDACREGVTRVERDLGPVGILVNNAGITRDVSLHRMALDQWQDVLRTNLDSLFNMSRCVIEGMRERRFGRIVNLASINGQKGQIGQTNYAASKAGVLGFTRALALEGAHRNITVNAVAPGYCDTDMVAAAPADIVHSIVQTIPVGRLGRPEEIASLVAYLAREDAGFITGATFSINGGQWLG